MNKYTSRQEEEHIWSPLDADCLLKHVLQLNRYVENQEIKLHENISFRDVLIESK